MGTEICSMSSFKAAVLLGVISVSFVDMARGQYFNGDGGTTGEQNSQRPTHGHALYPYGAVPPPQDNTMMMFLMMNMMNGQNQQNEMLPLMFLMMNGRQQGPVNNGGNMEQMLMLMLLMNNDKHSTDVSKK